MPRSPYLHIKQSVPPKEILLTEVNICLVTHCLSLFPSANTARMSVNDRVSCAFGEKSLPHPKYALYTVMWSELAKASRCLASSACCFLSSGATNGDLSDIAAAITACNEKKILLNTCCSILENAQWTEPLDGQKLGWRLKVNLESLPGQEVKLLIKTKSFSPYESYHRFQTAQNSWIDKHFAKADINWQSRKMVPKRREGGSLCTGSNFTEGGHGSGNACRGRWVQSQRKEFCRGAQPWFLKEGENNHVYWLNKYQ